MDLRKLQTKFYERILSMYCEGFHVTKRWILGFNPRFKDFKQDLKI